MWVYTPLFVPRYTAAALELNGTLLAWQVRLLRRRLGMKHPSAGISMPTMTPAVERLPWVRVVPPAYLAFPLPNLSHRWCASWTASAWRPSDQLRTETGVEQARNLARGKEQEKQRRFYRRVTGTRNSTTRGHHARSQTRMGFIRLHGRRRHPD